MFKEKEARLERKKYRRVDCRIVWWSCRRCTDRVLFIFILGISPMFSLSRNDCRMFVIRVLVNSLNVYLFNNH